MKNTEQINLKPHEEIKCDGCGDKFPEKDLMQAGKKYICVGCFGSHQETHTGNPAEVH